MFEKSLVLLDQEQAAEYLNVSPRTARTLFEKRAFETVKIGRRVLAQRNALDEYVIANTRPAVGGAR